MPDITKCSGSGCMLRETCYRYTAESSEFRQSWFSDNIIWKLENGEFKCDSYYPDMETEDEAYKSWLKNKNNKE
jgi:hypothetical protein